MTSPTRLRRLKLSQDIAADSKSNVVGSGVVSEEEDSEWLRVGDLAKRVGVTVRTLHHYEELGLIEPAARSKGHYRLYDDEAVTRVRWIHKLKSLGLSLGDIRSLVRERQEAHSARRAAEALQSTYEQKLLDVRDRLQELQALEAELVESVNYLKACHSGCTEHLVPTACARCERQAQAIDNDLISGALS